MRFRREPLQRMEPGEFAPISGIDELGLAAGLGVSRIPHAKAWIALERRQCDRDARRQPSAPGSISEAQSDRAGTMLRNRSSLVQPIDVQQILVAAGDLIFATSLAVPAEPPRLLCFGLGGECECGAIDAALTRRARDQIRSRHGHAATGALIR
jgi:hypothetical protein